MTADVEHRNLAFSRTSHDIFNSPNIMNILPLPLHIRLKGVSAKSDLTKQGLRGGRQGRWERWREQKTKTAEKKLGTILGRGEGQRQQRKKETFDGKGGWDRMLTKRCFHPCHRTH